MIEQLVNTRSPTFLVFAVRGRPLREQGR